MVWSDGTWIPNGAGVGLGEWRCTCSLVVSHQVKGVAQRQARNRPLREQRRNAGPLCCEELRGRGCSVLGALLAPAAGHEPCWSWSWGREKEARTRQAKKETGSGEKRNCRQRRCESVQRRAAVQWTMMLLWASWIVDLGGLATWNCREAAPYSALQGPQVGPGVPWTIAPPRKSRAVPTVLAGTSAPLPARAVGDWQYLLVDVRAHSAPPSFTAHLHHGASADAHQRSGSNRAPHHYEHAGGTPRESPLQYSATLIIWRLPPWAVNAGSRQRGSVTHARGWKHFRYEGCIFGTEKRDVFFTAANGHKDCW